MKLLLKSIEQLWLSPRQKANCLIEPGLLPTGGILSIAGEPGVGKSWLVQQIVFEIASGRRILGLFPTKKTKVAHFEVEKRNSGPTT